MQDAGRVTSIIKALNSGIRKTLNLASFWVGNTLEPEDWGFGQGVSQRSEANEQCLKVQWVGSPLRKVQPATG